MGAGQVVEVAPTSSLLMNPMHEYTRGCWVQYFLLECRAERLYQIPGSVPSPFDLLKEIDLPVVLCPNANPNQHLKLYKQKIIRNIYGHRIWRIKHEYESVKTTNH